MAQLFFVLGIGSAGIATSYSLPVEHARRAAYLGLLIVLTLAAALVTGEFV